MWLRDKHASRRRPAPPTVSCVPSKSLGPEHCVLPKFRCKSHSSSLSRPTPYYKFNQLVKDFFCFVKRTEHVMVSTGK